MAWIELHSKLKEHPKTYALMRALNIGKPYAVGLLACLWLWAIENLEDGNLTPYPDAAIARAAEWSKRPKPFLDALISCGWIDNNGNGRQLHNWEEYTALYLEQQKNRREKTRERVRLYRERKKQTGNADVTRYDDVTEPLRNAPTVPNLTVPYILSKDNTSVGTDEQSPDELNSGIDQSDSCPHCQIMELYNSVCTSLPKISKVTEARQTTLRVWWRKDKLALDAIRDFFKRVEASDFLTGRTGNFHGCGFDWVIKPANRQKIIEGNYDNANGSNRFDGIKT